MAQAGVQTVRVAFSWATAQPYPNWSAVPPGQAGQFVDIGGVPTRFAITDEVASLAALYRLRLLPVVLYAPSWDAAHSATGALAPPARPTPYANYLTALIDRYGPEGTYWGVYGTRDPIRQWQVWNEPNIPYYWGQPSEAGYADLLRAAHAAIVEADPGAKTVLAGITNDSWDWMKRFYREPGIRSSFDVAAVNPFTSTPADVMSILSRVRKVMNAAGDRRKPMVITELSWTSAHGVPGSHFDWDTTPAGQARDISAVLPLLAADRARLRLQGFDYYTWIGNESQRNSDWNFAGLFRDVLGRGQAKPAYRAFLQAVHALEGCPGVARAPMACPTRAG
jgi:hypothetical protein